MTESSNNFQAVKDNVISHFTSDNDDSCPKDWFCNIKTMLSVTSLVTMMTAVIKTVSAT